MVQRNMGEITIVGAAAAPGGRLERFWQGIGS
jgi:hypothetical protein